MSYALDEPLMPQDSNSSPELTEKRKMPLFVKLLAEFMGTALLMSFLMGCTMNNDYLRGYQEDCGIQIGGALGLVVALFGPVSGAHFNPAVSLSFALVRPKEFKWKYLGPYCLAQCFGSFLGTGINLMFYTGAVTHFEDSGNLGHHTVESIAPLALNWSNRTSTLQAFFAEFMGTFWLVFIVFAVTNERRIKLGLPVAATLAVGLMCIINTTGPISGAGLNPARDLGPRFVALLAGFDIYDCFQDGAWVYTLSPLIAAPCAAACVDFGLPILYDLSYLDKLCARDVGDGERRSESKSRVTSRERGMGGR